MYIQVVKVKIETDLQIISSLSANVPRRMASEFIKNYERCVEVWRKKEIDPGIVVETAYELYYRDHFDLVGFQFLSNDNFKYTALSKVLK